MKPIHLMKCLLSAFLMITFCLNLPAQIPRLISYQGILSKPDGSAVTDGNYTISVKLFDALTGGNELWSEDHSVNTLNGLFSVNLGSNTALDLPFDRAYFASTSVDSTELLPRTALTASPYAFSAKRTDNNPFALDNADGSAQEVVFVDANSNVGIGTNQPFAHLTVQSLPGVKNELFLAPGNWDFDGDEAQITLGDANHRITTTFGLGTTHYDVDQFRFEGSSVTFENDITVLRNLGVGRAPTATFDVAGESGEFRVHPYLGSFNNTTLLGSMNSNEHKGVQFRFASGLLPNFVDIGTDSLGAFVIEYDDSPFFTLDNTGNLNITGTVFHASDQRYKKNIQAISAVLPQLMQVGAYHYDWKLEEFPNQRFTSERQLGFLAQELEAAFPELVHTNSAGYKSVDYSRMAPILVEAIKEQQAQIDQLKAEKTALKAELATLRSEVMSRLEALENKKENLDKPAKN